MKKKVLATLLVGAMAASLLAGCGTTVETTGSSDTQQQLLKKLRQQRPQKQERQAVLMFRQTLPYGHIQSVNGAMQRQLIP